MGSQRYCPSLNIDKESATPLHLQLSRCISDEIFKDRPAPGTPIVSQRQLAELLDLNRLTVNRAYKQLLADGILMQEAGQRTIYVTHQAVDKVQSSFPAIGIILPNSFSEYVGGIDQTPLKYVSGIFDRTVENGYAPMMLQPPPPETDAETTREWMEKVMPRLSAVIHLGHRGATPDCPLETICNESYLPQIFVSGYSDNQRIGSVCCDIESGFAALAGYLKDQGHRRIGVVGDVFDTPACFQYTYSMRTERGIKSFRNHDMELRDEWIVRVPLEHSTRPQLYQSKPRNPYCFDWLFSEDDYSTHMLDAMFERCGEDLPTVFWCSNDFAAIRLCLYLKHRNYRVPEDFSVVGTDGNREAEFAEVPLTTLRVPMYEIGRMAVDLSLEHFFQGVTAENRIKTVPAGLIIRDSVIAIAPTRHFPK